MIFNLILSFILFVSSSLGLVKTINRPLSHDSFLVEKSFDLDRDGKSEKIRIYSSLGENIGDENTKVYLNNNKKPILDLVGYFDGIQAHIMNPQGDRIIEMRTTSGHSVSTTFYIYKKGELKIVPASDAHPPTYYGIETRNQPELKDIDGDGILELMSYNRHFPPQKQRTVTVYKFNGYAFIKSNTYEEKTSENYL